MKQKITLVGLMLFFATFTFGQNAAVENQRKSTKSSFEKHLKAFSSKDKKNSHERAFQKYRLNTESTQHKSAQTIKQSLDSLIYQQWDDTTSQWIDYFKVEYTYDANGNLTQFFAYLWDETTSQWVASRRYEYTYDSNGNTLTEIAYEWDEISSQLVAKIKVEYTYGEYGKTQTIYYLPDEETGLLVLSWKEEIAYDSNGYVILYSNLNWNGSSGEFILHSKKELTNNSNGNVIQDIEYLYEEDTLQWYSSKSEYTYDENENQIQYIGYRYNQVTSQWFGDSKSEYSYDENGNMIMEIRYVIDNSSGQSFMESKVEYNYDTNGNPTILIYYSYYASVPIVHSKYVYSYDLLFTLDDLIMPSVYWFYSDNSNKIMNKPTEYVIYYWDSDLGDWVSSEKRIYYYSDDNSTKVKDWDKNISKIYPNPVSEYLTFSIADSNNATFEMFDLQGRKIMIREVTNNEKINLKNINSGMYIYNLYVNGYKQTGKLIKE